MVTNTQYTSLLNATSSCMQRTPLWPIRRPQVPIQNDSCPSNARMWTTQILMSVGMGVHCRIHQTHGANFQTPSEKEVFDDFVKTPEVSRCIVSSGWPFHWHYTKHAALKPFLKKSWPYYHKMQTFMPGTQPRETHAFDPGSSSSQSAMQALGVIDAEEDGAEDQVGPPLDSIAITHPAISSLILPDASSSGHTPSVISSLPLLSDAFSASGHSLPPTVHPHPASERGDILMNSVHSFATTSNVGSSSSLRKCKWDARSSSIQPPSSKQGAKGKTADLDPVIISNNLNSTLNRMVDVMEKSLNASQAGLAASSVVAPSAFQTTQPSSIPSQSLGPVAPAILSSEEILQQAVTLTMADGFLMEDELFAASLFFTSSSEDVVRAAWTFIILGNNWAVQCRFLLNQLGSSSSRQGQEQGRSNNVLV